MRLIPWCVYLLIAVACLAAVTSCTKSKVQSQQHFDQAIDERGTDNPIVKIEFVDLRGNHADQRCVFAAMLVEAVRVEREFPDGFERIDQLKKLIKEQPDHRFEFRKPEAIEVLQRMRSGFDMRKACKIIDSGRPAVIGDPPWLYAGEPDGSGWTKVD